MPVTRALLLVAVASTLACEARPHRSKKITAPVLAPAVAPSASSAAAPLGPAFVPLARAARDAATKVALGCRLRSDWGESYSRYSDQCTFPAPDRAALSAAAAALSAAPAEASGDALVFAEEVRLFTEWIELVKDGGKPGTLSHYQGLATAWNALQPNDRIAVDLRTKDAYDGTVIVAGAGGRLVWARCSTGPCVIVPRKER